MDFKDGAGMISILTPTWNRAAFLERLWNGLNSQTYRDFEWIVADDGSTDGTSDLIRHLAKKSTFPITLIQASTRIGKPRMDNEALAVVKGDFILWNGSDDYLLPQALENLITCWHSIPPDQRDQFIGVSGLNKSNREDDPLLSNLSESFDVRWGEMLGQYSDKTLFLRADEVRNQRFPEIDFIVPETAIWTAYADWSMRILPKAVKVVQYQTPNAVSFSGRMEYCRGRAYSFVSADRNMKRLGIPVWRRVWRLITFIRCAIHGEVSISQQLRWLGSGKRRFLFFVALPVAAVLALKDRLQKKVRYTHREFLAAKEVVRITKHQLSPGLPAMPETSRP